MHKTVTPHSGVTCDACHERRHHLCFGSPCDCLWCACFIDGRSLPQMARLVWSKFRRGLRPRMAALKLVAAVAFALLTVAAHAQVGFPYGSNCQGACGLPSPMSGNIINQNSIKCYLVDTSGNDTTQECGTALSNYNVATLPANLDPTAIAWEWTTTASSSAAVVAAAILEDADRNAAQNNGLTYTLGTSHRVVVHHLVPASADGSNGLPMGYYVCSSTDGSTSNPGGTTPGANYGNGWSCFPGPTGISQGPAHWFNVFTPNPLPNFPMQWDGTMPGQMTATPGYPSMLPIYLVWKGGNATTAQGTAAFPACNGTTQWEVGHTYTANTSSAPNTGQWYTCNGTAWVPNTSSPAFVYATNIVQGGNTYLCPASANGGVDPVTHAPKDTCKTSGAADSGISATPFYPGIWEGGSPSTDYRDIAYNSTLGAYYVDMNGTGVPLNPQPNTVLDFYPGMGAITGSMTVNITATLYTDETFAHPATGTTPLSFSYPITVAAVTPLAQSTPSASTDPNLPQYLDYNAQSLINLCTGTNVYSVDYWNKSILTYMWAPGSAGSFGELQTWNYDNSRMFTSASDIFLSKLDGTTWPTSWTASTSYGTGASNMAITPSTDTNGNTWLASSATYSGGTSGTLEPSWSAHPTPGTVISDGATLKWINVGNRAFWNRCVENSGVPYMNAVTLNGGGFGQFGTFPGALLKNQQRTNDATTVGTTVTVGQYSTALNLLPNGVLGIGEFNPFSDNAGRGAAYEADSIIAYWKSHCLKGNCSAFTGNDQFKRALFYAINSTFNYWDYFEHQQQFALNESAAYGPVIDAFYVGLGEEAVISDITNCADLDPTNTTGLCNDPRWFRGLKNIVDFTLTNWYDQTWAAGEGVHNYSYSFNPIDVQNHTSEEPFYTELTGPLQPAIAYLFSYCGGDTVNCVGPSSVHYDSLSSTVLKHQFDNRACNNWTCIGSGLFYGVAWNNFAPNGFGTGSPKQAGQANKFGLGNTEQWVYGTSNYLTTDLSPSRNPVWNGGSGSQPYPDTQPPYPIQIIQGGEQGDPGGVGHFTGQTYSPVQSVGSTSAIFQFKAYEPAACTLSYATNTTCNAGTVTSENAGYPATVGGYNLPVYQHQFTLAGLAPSTNYYVQIHCTDPAANVATNSCPALAFQGGGINFTTLAATGLAIITSSLPNGALNVPYACGSCLQADGGTPPYAWTLNSGALPLGLTLNSNGTITGTPTAAGTASFSVKVTDNVGNSATSGTLTITITNLTIVTSSLPAATQGTPYSQTLTAAGGVPAYTWGHILGLLPPGLGLAPTTGIVSGTPTACGTYPGTFTITDSTGTKASRSLPITVGGCSGSLTLSCPTYPSGVINQTYPTQSCTIVGGVAPYTCSISSGALPTGLTVGTSGSTCTIAGTPTATGVSSFNIHVHDSTGTPLTADSPGSITIISTGQLGVTLNGSVTLTGSTVIQ